MKNKKAFTLIELIVVLVILAIISLIVTPLVLNIVDKAKVSANKRSIDAYGKAIDLAIASYLLDKGDFPTSIEELTIEYTGSKVECGVAQINEDSSVYLSKCKVDGIKVKDNSTKDGWYHYGTKATYEEYRIGDEVTYNGMNFYVMADSDENSDSVTMLKAEPLSVDEVNTYGVGHVNRYTYDSVGTAYNNNGYGGMAYYSSETCRYIDDELIDAGCTTVYAQSEVKYVVDAWLADKFQSSDLKEDGLGYKARLITKEEYDTIEIDYIPSWVYNSKYSYWTMSPYNNSTGFVRDVREYGDISYVTVTADNNVVRPVVTLLKSAL